MELGRGVRCACGVTGAAGSNEWGTVVRWFTWRPRSCWTIRRDSLTTVSGVAFSVMLVIVQVGIFLGMLENASITIERLEADLWVTAKNTPNIDFANTFPELYVHRVRSVPGVLRADNLIVWFVHGGSAQRSQGSDDRLRPGRFPALEVPLERRLGQSLGPEARPLRVHRRIGGEAVRPVRGGRLSRIPGSPSQDHRPDPRGPLLYNQPAGVPRLSRGAGAGPPGPSAADHLHPGEAGTRAPISKRSARRSAAGFPTTTCEPRRSGRRGPATTGSRTRGWD